MKVTPEQRTEAIGQLRKLLPVGSDVYVIQRHCSSSGMQRRISVIVPRGRTGGVRKLAYDIHDITIKAGQAAGFTISDGPGARRDWEIVLNGAGMDMHFHFVYSLASALHGDGYALNKRTL